MSTKSNKKPTEEAAPDELGGVEIKAAEDGGGQEIGERKRGQQEKAFTDKLPDPCVYCGPSVRGVARQYTVYHGGIPEALKKFAMEHKAVKGLFVSVERFAKVRTRLETPGTAEFILFRKVSAEL